MGVLEGDPHSRYADPEHRIVFTVDFGHCAFRRAIRAIEWGNWEEAVHTALGIAQPYGGIAIEIMRVFCEAAEGMSSDVKPLVITSWMKAGLKGVDKHCPDKKERVTVLDDLLRVLRDPLLASYAGDDRWSFHSGDLLVSFGLRNRIPQIRDITWRRYRVT